MRHLLFRYVALLLFIPLHPLAWSAGWEIYRALSYVLALSLAVTYFLLDQVRLRSLPRPVSAKKTRERWRWRLFTYSNAFLAMIAVSTAVRHLMDARDQPEEYEYVMFVLSLVMIGAGTLSLEDELRKSKIE